MGEDQVTTAATDLKALNGLVLIKVLEDPGAAHPNDAALHFGTHQAPDMTVTVK